MLRIAPPPGREDLADRIRSRARQERGCDQAAALRRAYESAADYDSRTWAAIAAQGAIRHACRPWWRRAIEWLATPIQD